MTNEERKVIELALEALLKTQNEGFNLPGSAIREAITAIKEALAQPKKLDQDEVDIRSRLYQRIHELETQLAQPKQKPVATVTSEAENPDVTMSWWHEPALPVGIPLYTTPPQRPWVGLTEEDIDDAEIHLTSCRNNHESWIEGIQEFAQAIEAKLKEKNNA